MNDAFAQPSPGYLDPAAPGKPGDFDFLHGDWKIAHQRLLKLDEWDRFEGEATCWSILGGVASIEELRIPARDFPAWASAHSTDKPWSGATTG